MAQKTMRRTSTINKIRNVLRKNHPGAQVILYGSQARGDATPESDIDLLIILNVDKEAAEWKDVTDVTYPLYDIELEDDVTISPLVYTKKQWENRPFKTPFYINVMNEGIRL